MYGRVAIRPWIFFYVRAGRDPPVHKRKSRLSRRNRELHPIKLFGLYIVKVLTFDTYLCFLYGSSVQFSFEKIFAGFLSIPVYCIFSARLQRA
jgi:hypothetical protein